MNEVKKNYNKVKSLKKDLHRVEQNRLSKQEQKKKDKLSKDFYNYYINKNYPVNITTEQFKKQD